MFSRLMAKWRRGRSAKVERRLRNAVCQPLEGRVLLAHTIYVDVSSPDSGRDGMSWGSAFADLQLALGAAVSGDTIRVAAGTYKPTAGTSRTICFQLKTGVGIYGGYAGYGAADPDARDVATNASILSGDIGVAGDKSDNSYHVVVGSATDGTAVLDGCTITAGYANDGTGKDGDYSGGGMYVSSGSPTLTNCSFRTNTADQGGGMYSSSGSPTLTGCTFIGNSARSGGGMQVYSGSPTLTGCTFIGNAAVDVMSGGGGISIGGPATLTNCSFSGNTADYWGGGISLYGDAMLVNCAISGNTAGYGGGVCGLHGIISNCIVWGNSDEDGAMEALWRQGGGQGTDKRTVAWSDIQGGRAGTGNINADPKFVRNPSPGADDVWGTSDDDYGDLRLRDDSPCIDAGNNAAVPGGVTTDLAGENRFYDTPVSDTGSGTAPIVDMGAYEAHFVVGASAGGPYTVIQGQSITLSSFGASAAAGALQYDWEWSGDGKFDDATGANPVFSTAGLPLANVTVWLRVTDGAMNSAVATTTVAVVPTVVYVDGNATGANTGVTWADAYARLSTAMKQAVVGQQIHVADGTYTPTGGKDRFASFHLKSGIGLYGGYAGYGAADPNVRDVMLYPTILSGRIGTAGLSYHVVAGSGVDATAVLDGFTVMRGGAYDWTIVVYTGGYGGGMYNDHSSPTLIDCTFSGNSAGYGGGMYNDHSSPMLVNCTFSGNSTIGFSQGDIVRRGGGGGGMFNVHSSPTLVNCTFSGNSSPGFDERKILMDGAGGGMDNTDDSSPTVTNCRFYGNSAAYGGGIYNVQSSPRLTNCLVWGNTASENGGGIGMNDAMYFSNGFLAGLGPSTPTLINCTVSRNSAGWGGGGIWGYPQSRPTLTNCIVWGNTATANGGPQIGPVIAFSEAIVTYSDIEGGWTGAGNINTDPKFVRGASSGADGTWGTADDDYGDLSLQVASLCIGSGKNEAVPADITTDIAGNARIQRGTVDMGAYESAREAFPRLSINDVAVQEGDSGTTKMVFTVTLSTTSTAVISVGYATANASALGKKDYLAASGSITFAPGQKSKTIQVLVKGNSIYEANRFLKLNLSGPMNASIADGQGIGTIIDDDAPKVPRIAVATTNPVATIRSGQAGAVTFGSTRVGMAVATKGFRVTNTGTANLILGKISVPAGYQLMDGLVGKLAPGQSDVFTIKLLTKKVGTYAGVVSFGTNTAGKMFRFSVSGTVTKA